MLDVGAMTTFGYVWLRLGAGEPEEVGEASLVTGQCGVDARVRVESVPRGRSSLVP